MTELSDNLALPPSFESSMADDTEDPEDLNVKRILRTFIDKADFLVDEDLNSLMEFMEDKDKLLVKIGSILGSLGVTEISELERIIQHLGKLSHLDSAKRRSKVTLTYVSHLHETFFTFRCCKL